MRAEKDHPELEYKDFWDWVLIEQHRDWLLALVIGYGYYLSTTYEVKSDK